MNAVTPTEVLLPVVDAVINVDPAKVKRVEFRGLRVLLSVPVFDIEKMVEVENTFAPPMLVVEPMANSVVLVELAFA